MGAVGAWLERWWQPRPLRVRELAAALAALAVLGAVAYAPHLRDGGFYSDDWASAATYRFAPEPRYREAAAVQRAILGARPGPSYAQPLPHAAFGERPAAHIALAVALAVAVSLALFALLRTLGLATLPALAAAGLALVFPWSDAVRLWPIAGLNQLAPLLWLAGALVALRALRAPGRAGLAGHGLALVLYAAALLTYEAVGGLVLATGSLYLIPGRAPRGRALARWGADAALAIALLAWARRETAQARELSSLSQLLEDVPTFARQALELAGQSLVPAPGAAPLALVALAALAATLAVRRRTGDPEVRRWLAVAAAATAATVAALAPFVGSGLHPLDEGLSNRGNLTAGLTLSVGATAVLALTGRALARTATGAAAVTSALVLALGAAYAYRVRGDIVRWDRAAAAQERVLERLGRALPDPPARAVVYAHGQPLVVSPGVPIFSQPWDLAAAIRLRYGDPRLNALPLAEGSSLRCGATGLHPVAAPGPWGTLQGGYGPAHGAPYGRAVLFDAATEATRIPRDAAACRRAATTLRLAPFAGDPR